MGLIELVIIAALTTASIAWYKFYYSTMLQANFLKLDNSFTRSPILSGSVFFIISLVLFPIMLFPVIVPSMEEKFKIGFEGVLLEED